MSMSFHDTMPRHGAIWGKVLIDELTAQGFTHRQIVGNSGIDLRQLEREDPTLRFDELALLFERAAELTENDLFGFECGFKREIRRAGIIAYVGQSSPNVADFLENLSRYQRILGDAVEIDMTKLRTQGVSEWHFNVLKSVNRKQYVEFGVSGLTKALRTWTNRHLCPELIEFRHHRVNGVDTMERHFGCEIRFGSDENRVHIRPADLEIPFLTADDILHRILQRCCEKALKDIPGPKRPLIVEVENEIARRLSSGRASQQEIARSLGMSVSTLSRRLAEAGTSFSQLVQGYKTSMAKSLVSESALQLTEIAFLLGYRDLSTFSSAFKRWTGSPPSRQRTND